MLSFRCGGVCFLVLGVGVACGGSSFSAAPMTGDESGGEGGVGGGDSSADVASTAEGGEGGAGDAGSSRDGGGGTADGATDGPATQDASDAPAMPCPLVRGTYMVTLVTGAAGGTGCGDLDANAPQCIRQPVGSCTLDFTSNVSGGGPPAINGSAMLGADGAFTGASLTEGSVDRSGCTGVWNPATSTMTVDCGGVGNSQSCVVKLARTGIVGACN